jgi:hypothetical protein
MTQTQNCDDIDLDGVPAYAARLIRQCVDRQREAEQARERAEEQRRLAAERAASEHFGALLTAACDALPPELQPYLPSTPADAWPGWPAGRWQAHVREVELPLHLPGLLPVDMTFAFDDSPPRWRPGPLRNITGQALLRVDCGPAAEYRTSDLAEALTAARLAWLARRAAQRPRRPEIDGQGDVYVAGVPEDDELVGDLPDLGVPAVQHDGDAVGPGPVG